MTPKPNLDDYDADDLLSTDDVFSGIERAADRALTEDENGKPIEWWKGFYSND